MSSSLKAHLLRAAMFTLGSLLALLILINQHPSHSVHASGSGTVIYTHITTSSNSAQNWTTLDNSVTNNNPDALVFVTQNWAPSGVYNNHPIAVRYSKGRWNIFNQDNAPLPLHAAFNIYALASSTSYANSFTHIATAENSNKNTTTLNVPTLNSADAVLLVTVNSTPYGVNDPHPIGVWFNGSSWTIQNLDGAPIPLHAAFNVVTFSSSSKGTLVHHAQSNNTSGNHTDLLAAPASTNPRAIVFITAKVTSKQGSNSHYTGVWYHAGHWSIFNQDGSAVPEGAAFNVNS